MSAIFRSRRRSTLSNPAAFNVSAIYGPCTLRLERTATTTASRPRGYGRSVYWSSDHVRRAAAASRDYFVLARVALESAIRNDDDVLALLPSAETPAASAQRISACNSRDQWCDEAQASIPT